MTYEKITETNTTIDENGNSISTKSEKSITKEKFTEPDYIKIYTNMWCEFNKIPITYRQLFLALAVRMTYCNSTKLGASQLVTTGTPYREDIMESCGWTSKAMFQRGLKELCGCGAIKRVARGVYQVNPSYAGKGKWLYDSRLNQGGIKDLIATFNFKEGTNDTQIIWADDGTNNTYNEQWRKGLNVKPEDETILKVIKTKKEQEVKKDL